MENTILTERANWPRENAHSSKNVPEVQEANVSVHVYVCIHSWGRLKGASAHKRMNADRA